VGRARRAGRRARLPPDAAISYSWETTADGPNGFTYDRSFGGGLDFRSHWDSGTQFAQVPTTGFYYGSVYTFTSMAILYTGAVCWSNGPSDETNVY